MARLAVGLSALVFAAVVALLWVQRDQLFAPPDDPAPIAAPDRPDPPPESILSAIETLESESDAKCNSSANRFEDFIYGTPLADEGRWTNVDLQKRWVQRIWTEASEAASREGEATVSPQRLREQIEQWLDWSEAPGGQIEVRFIDHPPLTISKLRAEQYGSIAYSLRAILSVQQDRIISSGDGLLTLDPGSIEVLRESTDTVTLSALMIADQNSRELNEFEITGATLRSAWSALLPNLEDSTPPGANPSFAADEKSRSQLLAMLDEMIAGKISAYQAYNDLDQHANTETLLQSNVTRFYARAPIPRKKLAWTDLLAKFKDHLNEFTMDLLLEASANATGAGHDLARAIDASRAVQRLTPHEIDDFEDVRIFPRLASTDQITVTAPPAKPGLPIGLDHSAERAC